MAALLESNKTQAQVSESGILSPKGTMPTDKQLRDYGYILAIDYGASPSETPANNRQFLQDWIDAVKALKSPGWLHSGTYEIDDTLRCFLVGPTSGGNDNNGIWLTGAYPRPLVKASSIAPLFENSGNPRPLICWRHFTNSGRGRAFTQPSHPLENPNGWRDQANVLFSCGQMNIDIDTNGHDGAIGYYGPAAQWTHLGQMKVTATGSPIGVWGVPGRSMGSHDIEIIGGGICLALKPGPIANATMAAACVAGLKITCEAGSIPIQIQDGSPYTIVGFEVLNCDGPMFSVQATSPPKDGVGLFIDGRVEIVGGGNPIAFDNMPMKNLYLRSVYVTGTDRLVKSGRNAAVTGSGTWKRIAEYVATDPDSDRKPYAQRDNVLETHSLIDGVVSEVNEPIVNIENGATDPTQTIRTKHIIQLPQVDDGIGYEDMAEHGAVAGTEQRGVDCRPAFEAAQAAAISAGHNRVFLRRGLYHISETPGGEYGIRLESNTHFFGVASYRGGSHGSVLWPHRSWTPTSGSPFMVDTVSDTAGRGSLTTINIRIRRKGGRGGNSSTPLSQDRFSHLRWRLGRNSFTAFNNYYQQFVSNNIPTNARSMLTFAGGGGGRHYGNAANGRGEAANDFRMLKADRTTEPAWFYGFNPEASKIASPRCDANIEINGCQNMWFFSLKREGDGRTCIVVDSENIAFFGSASMVDSTPPNYAEILGTSTKVLFAMALPRREQGQGGANVLEDLDGFEPVSVPMPDGVSIYKRGELDDAAMTQELSPFPPATR